jgi:GH35 family endo-1,4-beta-xylanase
MKRSKLRQLRLLSKSALLHGASLTAIVAAASSLIACNETEPSSSEETAGSGLALKRAPKEAPPYSCGYQVTSDYHSRWRHNGYFGEIELVNISGEVGKTFEVFADLGGATIEHCSRAEFTAVDGGYLLTEPDFWTKSKHHEDERKFFEKEERFFGCEDRHLDKHGIRPGHDYSIFYVSRDEYQPVSTYMISVNGVQCDPIAPTVSLDASGNFFTSSGTLTLTATASDNVAVKKVVFLRDGKEIGVDRTAPYSLDVAVDASLNGRTRYTAVAYDISNNTATSNTKSALTSVGNKFFGTEVDVAVDYSKFLEHFNQVTPGNSGKWGTVEATRDVMNWAALDTAYEFAQTNHLPFKLHTLIWGSQQPSWLTGLTPEEQLVEIEQWMAAAAERYPNVTMVDVVNEPLHAPPAYKDALGGAGVTGYDWVIKSFELGRKYFPNAELLINDYNVEAMASWATDYLNIIELLKSRGLVDGIGLQSHFLERADLTVVASNLDRYAATGLPIYISELDINFANDARQAQRMRDLFTLFWNHPSVVGITHWGYLQGAMWQKDAYLLKTDGTARPALTWLECFKAGGTDCTVPEYVPDTLKGDASGITLEAEDYDSAQGLIAAGTIVAYTNNGSWLSYEKVAFDANWNSITASYAHNNGNAVNLTVHLDSADNAPIATLPLAPTGGWNTLKTVTLPVSPMTGTHKVIVRFGGGVNLDSIKFLAPAGTGTNIINDSDFENGTTGGFWSWGAGTIANTTTRAFTGTHSISMTNRTGNSPFVVSMTNSAVAGTTYKASVWATIGNAASATAYITTALQCVGGSTTYGRLGGWGATPTITDGNWVEFTGDIVVPNCTLANVAMWMEGPGAGVDLYIDHVSVRAPSNSGPVNLITDGTFESGQGGWGGWGYGSLAVTNTSAHGGTQSLKATTMQSNGAISRDILSVVAAGKRYKATAWVSVDSLAAGSGSVKFQTIQRCNGATGDSYPWLTGATVTNGVWQQITGTVDLSACTTVEKLMLFVGGAETGNLYIDDITLTAL